MGYAEFFESTVLDAFRFLMEDFAFKHSGTKKYQRETNVSFRNQYAEVCVHEEAGCRPWVVLGRMEDERVIESHGLYSLVRLRCPDKKSYLKSESEYGTPEREELVKIIKLKAKLLRENGKDIMTGDFSVFPELKRIEAIRMREDNKKNFGTSTGESSRFDHRPSLKELFRDVKNPGIAEARVYQAYWDYDYDIKTISEFLSEKPSAVKKMLAHWDGLEDPILR